MNLTKLKSQEKNKKEEFYNFINGDGSPLFYLTFYKNRL